MSCFDMTASVISQDLDVSVIKGLRLLHSTEPDAEDQLHQLWNQSVVEKFGTERTPVSVLYKVILPLESGLKRESSHEITGDDFTLDLKKTKSIGSPTSFQKSSPASPQNGSSSLLPYLTDDIDDHASSSEEDSDCNDSPLEILNNEGVCVKCKISSSSTNNKLVECVDCQKHYHQQCHFPPITDMDLSDPRFVWYCSACEQNITTTASSDKTKSSSSSTSNVNKPLSSSKNVSSPVKSGRSYGTSLTKAVISNSSSKISGDSSPKHSKDKKSHLIKKRSLKKHEKKKSSK